MNPKSLQAVFAHMDSIGDRFTPALQRFRAEIIEKGNVQKVMKKQSGRQGKTSTSRPLEGGGKRVGVKELRDVARALRNGSTDTEVYLWRRLRNRGERGDNF